MQQPGCPPDDILQQIRSELRYLRPLLTTEPTARHAKAADGAWTEAVRGHLQELEQFLADAVTAAAAQPTM